MHRPIARNFALQSENKIHSDAIARQLGFTGALVPGVTVFGHLAWPLTQELGTRWLEHGRVATRFLKPAYDGERLSITHERQGEDFQVECRNESGTLLATLSCGFDFSIAPHVLVPKAESEPRTEITWDNVIVNRPFPSYAWAPDTAHNMDYANRVDDATELFMDGVLHPHAILAQANQSLVRRFVMPAWIHTGSEIHFHQLLRVGDQLEVRAVPIEKWEKKGHQFLKLYIQYIRGNTVVTEIDHTAIFRVAEASQPSR